MHPVRIILGWLCLVSLPLSMTAQRITYSEEDREDVRQVKWEIIGKVANQYMVYKNIHSRHMVTVYDQDMKTLRVVDLSILNDRLINVDFVNYGSFAYMIYQYEKKGIVYCLAQKLGGDGSMQGNPQLLDTTSVGVFGDNKIYSTIYSEDKSKIMVFKIKGRNTDYLFFTTILLDQNLNQLKKSRFSFRVEEHRDIMTDFNVNNDGDFVFGRCERNAYRDNVVHITLAMKTAMGDSLMAMPIEFGNLFLDDVKLKVDNYHGQFVLNSFFSNTHRGNVDGMWTAIVDKAGIAPLKKDTIMFPPELRARAKGDNSVKGAFNDYFIKNIIVTKDKGYLLITESEYSSQRGGGPWNRYDYLNNPYSVNNPYDYYSYNPWNNYGYGYSPYYRGFGYGYPYYQPTRYYSDDIALFLVDQNGKQVWNQIIPKAQFDDDEDNRLSFQLMLQGGALHFLYNEWNKRTPILTDDAVTPDGQLNRQEPLHNLDRGYEFLIRLGKQISSYQMLVPCIYRNSLAFALIDYSAPS
jgi:hypothetical protein